MRNLQSRTPARGTSVCAWHSEQQRRTTGKRALYVPERAELWDRLAKEAFWSPATRGLKKDSYRTINPTAEEVLCPYILGADRVPASQAAAPLSCSTLTGAELPQAKKVLCLCAQGHFGCAWLCDPVDCGLLGFFVRERGSPGKNTGAYWPILVAIPF